jgi:hypothetical protein
MLVSVKLGLVSSGLVWLVHVTSVYVRLGHDKSGKCLFVQVSPNNVRLEQVWPGYMLYKVCSG